MKEMQKSIKKLWDKSKFYAVQTVYVANDNAHYFIDFCSSKAHTFKKATVKKYTKLKNKIEYAIKHENTRFTKEILFTFLYNMLYVLFVSICILLSIRLLGFELNFINLASCLGLYFLLQEIPPYTRQFRQ